MRGERLLRGTEQGRVGRRALAGVRRGRFGGPAGAAALFAFVAVAFIVAAGASPAYAVTSATYTGTSFGPDGTAGSAFAELQSIAVDPATEDVYAYDPGAGKVYKFDSEGKAALFSGLPGNAIEGVGSSGESGARYQVAVAPAGAPGGTAGDIYVATGATVEVYAASGARLGEFGPAGACGVATDPAGDVFVGSFQRVTEYAPGSNPPSSADQVGASSAPLPPESCNVGVDGLGNVYVANGIAGGITKLDGLAAPRGAQLDPTAATLAVDPTLNEVYALEGVAVAKYDATGRPLIKFADSGPSPVESGAGIALNAGSGQPASGYVYVNASFSKQQIEIFRPIILPDVEAQPATDVTPTSATLHGTISADGGPKATCKFQYVSEADFQAEGFESAASAPCSPAGPFSGESANPVSAKLSGVSPGTVYRFRLLGKNSNGTNPSPARSFGPPQILSSSVFEVTSTEALLGGSIDPKGLATSYVLQYVSEAQFAASGYAGATSVPLGGAAVGAGEGAVEVSQRLSGLAPLTTYHFRLLAENDSGTAEGDDATFTTYPSASSSGLPDGRGYEMVSLPAKNGAEIAIPEALGGSVGAGEVRPLQADPTGDAITYSSFTAFGNAQGAPGTSQYISRRGAEGWSTQNITPPNEPEGEFRDPLQGFSEDLSQAAVAQYQPTLTPDASLLYPNLYLQNNLNGAHLLLSPGAAETTTSEPRQYVVSFSGASSDFGHIIFSATGVLSGEGVLENANNLYEWSDGQLKLVSRLPNGVPAEGAPCFGRSESARCDPASSFLGHAISADGSRIFWTDLGGSYEASESPLFARVDGRETFQLDATQGGPGPGGQGRFWTASSDGSRVFFTDVGKLTAQFSADNSADLYEYDFDQPPGSRLKDLTVDTGDAEGAGVEYVLGASEDGSYLYFIASGVLGAGAQQGEPNVYVRHDGETRFIATISRADYFLSNENIAPYTDEELRTARVSPNGHHLTFTSLSRLTGYDNRDQASGEPDSEVFLYDAEEARLHCVSCNPSGARPTGRADTPILGPGQHRQLPPYQEPRFLSADGNRVFFESKDSLAQADTNGKEDVYEWERLGEGGCSSTSAGDSAGSGGCVSLISTGRSPDNSYFADASEAGSDVFFLTRQPLLPQDEDEHFDMYDARVGGGFPIPPRTFPCQAEACHGSGVAPPPLSPPASSAVRGPGNRAQHQRCPKGKVSVRKHGRRRCVKRHHRHLGAAR